MIPLKYEQTTEKAEEVGAIPRGFGGYRVSAAQQRKQ